MKKLDRIIKEAIDKAVIDKIAKERGLTSREVTDAIRAKKAAFSDMRNDYRDKIVKRNIDHIPTMYMEPESLDYTMSRKDIIDLANERNQDSDDYYLGGNELEEYPVFFDSDKDLMMPESPGFFGDFERDLR